MVPDLLDATGHSWPGAAMSDGSREVSVNEQIDFVLDRFNSMLAADGARVEVEALDAGILRLRYVAGPAGECDACVLDPDDLEMLIGEALAGKVAAVATVTVERVVES